MDIFVCLDLTAPQIARLREVAGADRLHFHGLLAADAGFPPALASCEAAFGNPPAEWLARAEALRWVQLESVGFDGYRGLDWGALGRRITMTNLAGFFAEPVAETALAGILALVRGLDRLVRLQAARDWRCEEIRRTLRTLAGATVVLFGYGAINRRLAALLEPFGCAVEPFGRDWTAASLDRALARADVVVCTAPETDATVGVFDAARLAALKQSAFFVNLGRGSVVVEDALAERLRQGRLGGALIDVTLAEPLPPEHVFWSCPNLILTQHTSGGTEDEMDRKIEVFADNLARFRAGDSLVGVVDFEKGY